MTEGNLNRLKGVHNTLDDLIKGNPNAQTTSMYILTLMRTLMLVLDDLNFRPEVNS